MVFGSILVGIPESLVIGLSLVSGTSVSVVMVIAVFLSNMPEAVTAKKDLLNARWRKRTIIVVWLLVVIVLGLSSLMGFAALDSAQPSTVAFVLSFAAGALLPWFQTQWLSRPFRIWSTSRHCYITWAWAGFLYDR